MVAAKRLPNGSWVDVEVEERVRQRQPDIRKILRDEHTLNRFVRIMRKNLGEEEAEPGGFGAPVAVVDERIDGDVREAAAAEVKRPMSQVSKTTEEVKQGAAVEDVGEDGVELIIPNDEASASESVVDGNLQQRRLEQAEAEEEDEAEDTLSVDESVQWRRKKEEAEAEIRRRKESEEFGITAPLAGKESAPASARTSYAESERE